MGDPREISRGRENQSTADQSGDQQSKNQCENRRLALDEQHGAWINTVQNEHAEEDRHLGAARDAEGERRNQRAAVLGIVGRLRRNHAANVAGAEMLTVPTGLGGKRVR